MKIGVALILVLACSAAAPATADISGDYLNFDQPSECGKWPRSRIDPESFNPSKPPNRSDEPDQPDQPDQPNPLNPPNLARRRAMGWRPSIPGNMDREAGQWPFFVWLRIKTKWCIGTIVRSDLIFTHGKCLPKIPMYLYGYVELEKVDTGDVSFIIAGEADRKVIRGTMRRRVKAVELGTAHDRESGASHAAFARVWLSEPIIFSDYIQPVCIPKSPSKVTKLLDKPPLFFVGAVSGENCVGDVSGKNASVKVGFLPIRCEPRLNARLSKVFRCVACDVRKTQTCMLDYGGPLVARDENGRWSLAGIADPDLVDNWQKKSQTECKIGYFMEVPDPFIFMDQIVTLFDKNFEPRSSTPA